MDKINRTAAVIMLVILISSSVSAQYKGATPEGWPCVQRYMSELSARVFWTGELPDASLWHNNQSIIRLADKITDRSVRFEETHEMITTFFNEWDGNQAAASGLLIGAITEQTNKRRERVLAGIGRFSDRQQMMITRIEEQAGKIDDIENGKGDPTMLDDLRDRQKWDIRVFEEREKLSSALCEQPVLLEQRLFAIGRYITEYVGQAK